MRLLIEEITREDWDRVRSIYLEGIATGNATFETEAPAWPEWDERFHPGCRLVARLGDEVVGWAGLSPVSSRRVYDGVAEISVYVKASAWGRGAGKSLLERLIEESERAGFWTLQAGIFPENIASLQLVRSCGFRDVGRRERLGRMNERWRDVILVERRSIVTGT